MTDRELKMYALAGLLVRINAEKEKADRITDTATRQQIESKIEYMCAEYDKLLAELKKQGKTLPLFACITLSMLKWNTEKPFHINYIFAIWNIPLDNTT